jgi:hypothetical protein
MNISDKYNHLGANTVIKKKNLIYREVEEAIKNCNLRFGHDGPREIKRMLVRMLNITGWADRVKIKDDNQLTVSFVKGKIGVCIQLGNVARTYADLLKLAYLWDRKVIDVAVVLVPDSHESKLLGANYANFDRLSREIDIFKEIIKVPTLILALSS